MYKKIGLVSILLIAGVWAIIFFGFSNKITAEIPSATSFVLANKDWTVHFSEPMDPDTFTHDTVMVESKDGVQIATEMEWNDSFTVLTLRAPVEGYKLDEEYEIIITKEVLTASGEKLPKTFTHNFTAMANLPSIKDQKQLVTLLKERMREDRAGFNLFSSDANEDAAMETAESSNDSSAGGDGTSSTNVQVEGIGEADIIKTDGKSIFFVRDGDIIITSTDKEKSSILSQIKIDNFYPQEIYVQDDLLITIGQKSEPLREVEESELKGEIGIPEPIYYNQTTILFYNIKNPSKPKQVREVSQEGSYNTSRILDGYLYVIANEHPPYHILRSEEDVEVRPFIKDTAVSEASTPVDFEDMYFFPESKEEQFLMLTSIDLNDMEKEANMETYLGASNQIYMSHDNLYVAVNKYKELEETDTESKEAETSEPAMDIAIWRPQDVDTEITQFSVDNGTLTYNASTLVNGTLINQFAMDERNNTFRVATTKDGTTDEENLSTNNLYTFDSNLKPLGSVEGLAEGERIYSVRFMDNVAYMVTFKEVDPLFVIDLEDPENPSVLGELKIPGFSNYLHPLDENHVIGFGQNTKLIEEEGNSEPRVQTDGIKISVFDVSDPTNPKEKFSEVIGQGWSYSELLYNHKVLFKHPTENLFGFPAVLTETKTVRKKDITYEEDKVIFEGALLYEITPNGIKLMDTITHQGDFKEHPEWLSEIRRIVSVDDTIYTFSWDTMKVYDMDQKQILKTIELPELSFEY
ncbi:beta-propeller domain-containing protein [Paucisalibacillus sp. EB02]|uniref:beta-propeller domain-containing protein n=1 Tax=Paucisalibacillus sp. EB02 TaxID=1347087 RepID=UPI000694E5F9|nr:beta-propeller domain-containing protein [Paucisalibacillus sp. EB02]